jgi:CheY-like chemotaxis protein
LSQILQALLLTRDQEVLRVIRRVLETVSIDLQTVTSTDQSRQIISRKRFDTILIDSDDVQDGAQIIREIRRGKSNAKAIVFAITNNITTVRGAFELGANFVLDKPISPDRAARGFRAAHGLIVRERLRYHRHEVTSTVHLTYGPKRDLPIALSNVSEGGLALHAQRMPDMQGPVLVRFDLPGCTRSVEANGEFVWSSNTGRVGIRFTNLSANAKAALELWLYRQLQFVLPGLQKSVSSR